MALARGGADASCGAASLEATLLVLARRRSWPSASCVLAVADDGEGRRRAGRQRRHAARQIAGILDRLPLIAMTTSPCCEAGLGGRAARHDAGDDGALGRP